MSRFKYFNKIFTFYITIISIVKCSYFNKISASWELGFNDYVLAVGSQDLKDAEIITDPNHISEMKHFLKHRSDEI